MADQLQAAVAERVHAVRERARRAGGADVGLIAVTKSFGVEAILAALAAGCVDIGENYAQELIAKAAQLAADHPAAHPTAHFIGQAQRNKVRQLAGIVACWDSVDRVSLADEIARRAPGARVLVQVRPADQPAKGGCAPGDAAALVEHCRRAGLAVEGLMTVGPTDASAGATRAAFRQVRSLVDELGLRRCSMGMSDDLEIAVEEGATELRIGSALFGPRPRRG